MRKQRWCGALLALALVLTLLPTAALATTNITGSGTESAPYLIYTAAGLKDFRDRVNKRYGNTGTALHAKLMNDIVLNDGTFDEDGTYTPGESGKTAEQWTPIGGYNAPRTVSYTGTFNGDGHTIKGLYINGNQFYIGLFGFVNNATIKNLTVTGYVKGGNYVGGIVGGAEGSSTIQNCVNYSTVKGDGSFVGGIVGQADDSSEILNCVNYSSVKGDGSGVGGLVGWASNDSITIQNCANCGNVTGSSGVGGIVGHAYESTIQNCVNYSTVTGDGSTVGGIVGDTNNSSTIQNCINLGNVTGKKQVGGLVGSFGQGRIQNCANLGGVKGSENYTGGIVGYVVNPTTMTACYNVGTVEGPGSVGGLVGYAGWYNPGDPGDNDVSVLTASSCYYLDTAATKAFGNAEHFTGDTSACSKTKTEFANELLPLLQNGDTNSPWTKYGYLAAANMTLPLLSGQKGDDHTCTYNVRNHNTTHHWNECECGLIEPGSKAAHSGTDDGDCTAGNIECETCGYLLTAQQSEHSFSGWTQDANASTHTRRCQNTGCTKSKTGSCADSDNDGKCDACGRALRSSTPYYPPSYAASVSETEHGSVTVSPRTAAAGTTVTVTVTPDRGYTLETLTVTDAGGKELPLTDKGDGKYTFTQPSSKVTVRATFMDDNTMLNFFTDVKSSDYFYDAVLWAAQKGITSGISATEFGPNQPCTRAQIVTFLWRAAGSPVVNYAMSMTDVPADAYYAEAVRWALSLGVTTGTGAGAFSPDASCTRAQAVTFLARALNAKASGKAAFSDVPSGSYYADAVAWAAENGVTTGTSATTFSPDDVCTRAQIVTFLYRAFQ